MSQALTLCAFLAMLMSCAPRENQPHSMSESRLIIRPDFPSALTGTRTVRIWLPPGYDSATRYPVLYMHDGQMLFDTGETWNGQSWQVDRTMDTLIREGRIRPVIIVGIDNAGPYRAAEYFPQAILDSISQDLQRSLIDTWVIDGPRADAYLRFLVEELKPYIDSTYATLPDRDNTLILGSSMGGLISLYALCEYPEVFGAAACMSTHWPMYLPFNIPPEPVDYPAAFRHYLRRHLPAPGHHRIYFDHGDQTLDAWYQALQQEIDTLMRDAGYTAPDWITRPFPGTDHSETAWAARFHIPAEFLLAR